MPPANDPTWERETEAARALSVFGVRTFRDFVRTVRHDTRCIAVDLVNAALDEGKTVQEIFFTGEEYGFRLAAAEVAPREFVVEFGCLVDPLAGDGRQLGGADRP